MFDLSVKSIIFDMDGTLSDTAKATTDALNKVGGEYGLPYVSNEHVRSAMGYADPEFFYRVYPEQPRDVLNEVRYIVNDLEDRAIEKFGRDILFPGVFDMLCELSNRGYFLYIASTGSTAHVETTLKSSGIEHLFKAVYCNEPVKIDMVKDIIGTGNAGEFVMVGDMIKDSEAAKGNGITALGAAFGYLKSDDRSLFDAVLYKPDDIYKYL